MKKENIRERLKQGIEMYKNGEPCPTESFAEATIEFYGWRYAQKAELDFQELIGDILDAYGNENQNQSIISKET